MDRLRCTAFHRSTAVQVIIKPQVWLSLSFLDQKRYINILYQHFNLCYIFSKNSWQATCYCEFYLCYSPQKTVLTFSSLQVAEKSSHARTVQTSDYSAMALKVLLLSDKRKKFASQIFLFGPRNSRPHVYCTVTGDHVPKKSPVQVDSFNQNQSILFCCNLACTCS